MLLATAFASVAFSVPTALVILVKDIPNLDDIPYLGPWGRILVPLGAALVGIAVGALTLNSVGRARSITKSIAIVGLSLDSASAAFCSMAGVGALLIGFP